MVPFAGELPPDVWADTLEEQGQDTAALRAWIAAGLVVCNGYGYGDGYGYGYGYGYGDAYGNGYGNGYGHGYGYGY